MILILSFLPLTFISSVDKLDDYFMQRNMITDKTIVEKSSLHPLVWILVAGVLLARMGTSLSVPFITLFLHEKVGLSFLHAGIIVSLSFIAYVIGGFIGGTLSDRYGRSKLIIGAIFILSLVFILFGLIGTYIHTPSLLGIIFAFLNLLAGVSRSWSETLSQALIADLTPLDQKRKAFSLRYTAANIGAAIGPFIGALLGFSGSMAGFYLTGSLLFVYFGIVCFAIYSHQETIKYHDSKLARVTFKKAFEVLLNDRAMTYFVLGVLLVYFGFVQQETSFAIIILKYTHSTHIFSLLLSMNAIMVILLQMPIVKMLEKQSPLRNMMVGSVFISLGLVIVAIAGDHQWMYYLAECILTFGEILVFPFNGIMIDSLAPETMRGTYFGAAGFQFIGRAIGPIFAGLLIQSVGYSTMLVLVAMIELLSVLCFYQGYKEMTQKTLEISLTT